ncbi:MAG: DsrE family protein [Chloroflexi bacterium]|nr:DsrE family protein [Chloroflexota bacterium]
MADKVLVILEKPIYLSFEPVDPHLFATAFGVADTPVEIGVLLRDSAVNYAVKDQDTRNVRIAGLDVLEVDVTPAKMIEFILRHGASVAASGDDLAARGIDPSDLVDGVKVIGREDLASLVEENDAVVVW